LFQDVLLYIYTSGTTGLPKPAIIKHSRYLPGAFSFFIGANLTHNDTVLVTLPIYHANGIIIGVGASLVSGATVVLRKKFSASAFWHECIQFKCTAFIYVGEVCRFLVNQPASSLDRAHGVKVAIGNGMRSNVWREFYKRFDVRLLEFYAASEGNCTMGNPENRIGSCGFVPLFHFLRFLLPVKVIRVDEELNPVRDHNGLCIECKPNEKGLLVGIIGSKPKTMFSGYANSTSESNKKILDNVLRRGQRAFNTGDILVCDSFGYLYFCDRTGDTYRWRGENVSTVEVENVISKRLGSREVVVYGVQVPGEEGRAGMAAIVVANEETIDTAALGRELRGELPAYSVPLFLRLVRDVEHTGTFKAKKLKLVEDGFDPAKCDGDRLFYFDTRERTYKPLDLVVLDEIQIEKRRF
jgi:solute carrier family 27 fatty acid transporter 1/4